MGDDPDSDQKVLANVKCNIRAAVPALFFEVDEGELPALENPVPFLVVDQEGYMDPIRLVASQKGDGEGKVGRPADKRAQAAEWLTNYLAEAGKPVKATTIYEDAQQYGMTKRTVRRAASPPPEGIGVNRNPVGGGPTCTWELPDEIKELLAEANASLAEAVPTPPAAPTTVAVVPDPPKGDAPIISEADLQSLLGEGGE